MGVVEAVILGIVQGLTEFLPVSSSGHIELGSYLLNVKNQDNLLFSIIVHGATALSTIVVFRKDIQEIFAGLMEFKWNDSTEFVAQIIISMIPVGIVGVFFEDQIEALFTGNIVFVASMLAVTGSLLLFTFFTKSRNRRVDYAKAFILGIAQSIAILPGISRSGSTIATALFLGIEKSNAARFSFLMVLPPILGATLLKVLDFIENPAIANNTSGTALLAGFIAAFVSGLLACQWMIKIVKKGKLIYFAIYCFLISFGFLIFKLL